jgi:hypothetical protein
MEREQQRIGGGESARDPPKKTKTSAEEKVPAGKTISIPTGIRRRS